LDKDIKNIIKKEDIKVGLNIKYKDKYGIIRFIGKIHLDNNNEYVGIEWNDDNTGKHDGIIQKKRYFQATKKNSSVFIKLINFQKKCEICSKEEIENLNTLKNNDINKDNSNGTLKRKNSLVEKKNIFFNQKSTEENNEKNNEENNENNNEENNIEKNNEEIIKKEDTKNTPRRKNTVMKNEEKNSKNLFGLLNFRKNEDKKTNNKRNFQITNENMDKKELEEIKKEMNIDTKGGQKRNSIIGNNIFEELEKMNINNNSTNSIKTEINTEKFGGYLNKRGGKLKNIWQKR
jgi:hypothetical protein